MSESKVELQLTGSFVTGVDFRLRSPCPCLLWMNRIEMCELMLLGLALQGRILVGHGLSNDLRAMMLDHPRKDMRDTARQVECTICA